MATTVIRKAREEELPAILTIYAEAREFMRTHGNPAQWGNTHPEPAVLAEDIRKGQLFVVTGEDGETPHGAFAFILGDDPTYQVIQGKWPNREPYGTIHRAAQDGSLHHMMKTVVAFAWGQIHNLRCDTHADNTVMQNALTQNGFQYCGVIRAEDGTPRFAYQKVL